MALWPGDSTWQLPDPAAAPSGVELLAIGADLEPATLLAGYRSGLFAMEIGGDILGWYSPDPRGILWPHAVHESRSLRRAARTFTVTFDQDFMAVVQSCADPDRSGSWITPAYISGYKRLHDAGYAHSCEVWWQGQLAGGIFGVEVNGLFAGESMFHRRTDASKVALVSLARRLAAAPGLRILDVQWLTPHLASMGAIDIPRTDYLALLTRLKRTPSAF